MNEFTSPRQYPLLFDRLIISLLYLHLFWLECLWSVISVHITPPPRPPPKISANFLKLFPVLSPMEPRRVCCNPGGHCFVHWNALECIILMHHFVHWNASWMMIYISTTFFGSWGRELHQNWYRTTCPFCWLPPPRLPAYRLGCDLCSLTKECQRVVLMPGIIFKVISLLLL